MVIVDFYSDDCYNSIKLILSSSGLYDPVWESRENLQRKIKRDAQSILVAKEGKQVIGCVFIIEDGWNAFIWRLCVAEDFQNKGVGSLLMNQAEKIVSSRGIKEVGLFVNPENQELVKWYSQKNYQEGSIWKFMFKRLDV